MSRNLGPKSVHLLDPSFFSIGMFLDLRLLRRKEGREGGREGGREEGRKEERKEGRKERVSKKSMGQKRLKIILKNTK